MVEPPSPRTVRKPALERSFELWLFRSRWLMAPFYAGLILALAALLWVFLKEAWHGLAELPAMTPGDAILLALSLIDLSLTGNLILIVIFSVKLQWLPSIYDTNLQVTSLETFWLQVKRMIMPVTVLALFNAAQISRFMRASMLEAMIGCSTCSVGERCAGSIWSRRRLKPERARACTSMPERLRSSSRSSCRWTPSRLACVG